MGACGAVWNCVACSGRSLSLAVALVCNHCPKKNKEKKDTAFVKKRVLHATACCICGIFNNGKCRYICISAAIVLCSESAFVVILFLIST